MEKKISEAIRAGGPMAFARFMERALYDPEDGYYTAPDRAIGRAGDFYTSVSVGPVFGELLAWQFARWLRELGGRGTLIEVAAHDGTLSRDVLGALRASEPGLYDALDYRIIEPLVVRRGEQEQALEAFAGTVRWHASWEELAEPVEGVIFSNEWLDAFPVHVLSWNREKGRAGEWHVGFEDGRLVWLLGELSRELSGDLAENPAAVRFWEPMEACLGSGCRMEWSPAAAEAWRTAAGCLRRGWLLAADYGGGIRELADGSRPGGTLRAYRNHRSSDNVLASPGEQDLTAHVNFDRILAAGESVGLRTSDYETQARWLTGIVQRAETEGPPLPPWTPKRTRQLQTLIHPDHLGERFRIIVQEAGHAS